MNPRQKALFLATALCAVLAAPAYAQQLDRKKLDYFVGKWKLDTDIKGTANSQAAKAAGSETCGWFANAHVVCNGESTGPTGPVKSMKLMSALMTQFASYTINSTGYVALATGDSQGDTWTFAASSGGLKTRYIIKTTKDSYNAVSEYAGPDGKWTTVYTVNATRVK